VTFNVIHLLQAFSNVIVRTSMQQLTHFNGRGASRGFSTVAELLV